MKIPEKYWVIEIGNLLMQLETSLSRLSEDEAKRRLSAFGHDIFKKSKKQTKLSYLLGFQPVPKGFLLSLALILISYITLAEIGKRIFIRNK